jgi:alanyl-tRNA synthetase
MDLYSFQTLSFHMGDEVSTIELGAKEISEEQILAAERQANTLARDALPVHVTFGEAAEVTGLRKQSQRSGKLRIVEIEGIDKSACGGTHVRSLAETLPVQIRKIEKVRGNVRLEFVCGDRAIRRAKRDFQLLQELSRQTAAAIDTLPDHAAALKDRLSEAEKDRQRLADDLAQREGREAYAASAPSQDGMRRTQWSVERVTETVRAKAIAYAAGSQSVVLVLGKQPPGVLIACSPDSRIDAGALLKQTFAEFGGRGGGSSTLAQGSIMNERVIQALAEKLGLG